MAYKADTSSSPNSIVVDGITSPATGDVQAVKILDGTPGGATPLLVDANGMLLARSIDDIGDLLSGATHLTRAFAFASVSASQTDSAVVAAVTSKVIRVLAVVLSNGAAASSVTFKSKPVGAGTAISMPFAMDVYGGFVLPYSKMGWFQSNSGEGLSVDTGAGAAGVQVIYAAV